MDTLSTKYSRSFIKLWLNPWCDMDGMVSATFLDLDRGNYIAVYGRVRELSDSSKTSYFVFWRWTKVLRVWNDMRLSN